ncbi:hypothetical protein AMTR_s00013p00203470 [Amborella trichopoda]|uniref:Uncharacterized protein n=1 Tax=Amborella trichopoda TaxID=13333 RepID=W1PPG6_AMBTC|nr:hypothetical protein AMTR_s00013p00203470 [Amborella trichopoda]
MAEAMDSPGSNRSSPGAVLGHKVEDLWDIQEPQLSPSEKLNSCFESIPVSSFPPSPSQGLSFKMSMRVTYLWP